jgi:hypothetical protein
MRGMYCRKLPTTPATEGLEMIAIRVNLREIWRKIVSRTIAWKKVVAKCVIMHLYIRAIIRVTTRPLKEVDD